MDGWETRRRRGPDAARPLPGDGEHDWALVRLGAPGVVRGVLVDTAHFRGNHPAEVAVDAAHVPGAPGPGRLLSDEVEWREIVPRTRVRGHAANGFPVAGGHRATHVRLRQFPDGGVARLRVHGEVLPDPRWLAALEAFDLACAEHGGLVEDASDRFYSPPGNLILPGRPRGMDEGWENRRRRGTGHDWVRLRLAGHGAVRAVEIDTSYFRGNAPGWAALLGCDTTAGADPADPAAWRELVPRTPLLPDTAHRFVVTGAAPVTHVRLEVLPDGGVARLRVHGALTENGRRELAERWASATGGG
jgi:allantoicase